MRVFFDVFSGDELLSDSYTITPISDGVVFEVASSWTTKGGEKIDIGRSDHNFGMQGAEGGEDEVEERVDDAVERVIDVKDKADLKEVPFTKKEYGVCIRAYLKKLKTHLEATNPERVEVFMKGASEFVGLVLKKFSEFKFYSGPSYDTDAMYVLSTTKEGDSTPTFYFFADGLNSREY